MSFVLHFAVHLLAPALVRGFWRAARRFPPLFAAVALTGLAVGAFLVSECGPRGDWPMAALGALCVAFYTGLLGLVAVKWWAGTWAAFCDHAAFLAG